MEVHLCILKNCTDLRKDHNYIVAALFKLSFVYMTPLVNTHIDVSMAILTQLYAYGIHQDNVFKKTQIFLENYFYLTNEKRFFKIELPIRNYQEYPKF